MRITTSLLLLALLGAGAPAQVPRTTATPNPAYASARLELDASVEPASIKSGNPIFVKLRLRNVSGTRVSVVSTADDIDYELLVTDATGAEARRTSHGRALFQDEFEAFRSVGLELDPGQEIQVALDITRIYELKQPGTYYLQAARTHILPDASTPRPNAYSHSNRDAGKEPIEKAVSNKVQFTVTP